MAEKKRTEVDWEDIRAFLALGRHGSLTGAARALSVTHATISRRIQSLELTLGDKLVERRPEGYLLTPAGTQALAVASDMETAAQTLGRGGTDGTPKGLVRVNAPPALTQAFLATRLAKLPARYSGLDIDMGMDLRSVSLERRETDIAIRLGRPEDGDFIAKRAGLMAYGFYGTPLVCQQVESGVQPIFLGFDEENADIPDAIWLTRTFPQARVAFRVNNQAAQAAAARAGSGLALLPHYIGRQESDLRLCRVEPVRPARDIWVLTRPQDRKNVAIRTVVDYLLSIFSDERALFEE